MKPDTEQFGFESHIRNHNIVTISALAPTMRNKSRAELYARYADKIIINSELSRSLVSFQANKNAPFYRWFKYKEAFSSELVLHLLNNFKQERNIIPRVLDPFVGAGITLTTAAQEGCRATGIELLPVGISIIKARKVADRISIKLYAQYLKKLVAFLESRTQPESGYRFPHITITHGAFPQETEAAISAYIGYVDRIKDEDVKYLFWFACFSILEDVSFTRKDGQYLRWDSRSGRTLKSNFNKGRIHDFNTAVIEKLNIMLEDIKQRNGSIFSRYTKIITGTCLEKLLNLDDASFDLIITSPPYCNRYDYTRTYALELAFLNHRDNDIKHLRQTLLSATVENKTKKHWLFEMYDERHQNARYEAAVDAFRGQHALREVLSHLYEARELDKLDRKSKDKSRIAEAKARLNNPNVPNMVEHYFFEMSFIIHELARVLAPNGKIFMVNDNVQYIGEEVPVDLILSDFASSAGLAVDCIWVLPKGKGNTSQQMGTYGRTELRKCVYVWHKPVA